MSFPFGFKVTNVFDFGVRNVPVRMPNSLEEDREESVDVIKIFSHRSGFLVKKRAKCRLGNHSSSIIAYPCS